MNAFDSIKFPRSLDELFEMTEMTSDAAASAVCLVVGGLVVSVYGSRLLKGLLSPLIILATGFIAYLGIFSALRKIPVPIDEDMEFVLSAVGGIAFIYLGKKMLSTLMNALLAVAGSALGYWMATVVIDQFRSSYLDTPIKVRVVYIIFTSMTGIAVAQFKDLLFIALTAVVGAFVATVGIDVLVKSGLATVVNQVVLTGSFQGIKLPSQLQCDTKCSALGIGFLCLVIFGVVEQVSWLVKSTMPKRMRYANPSHAAWYAQSCVPNSDVLSGARSGPQ